MFISLGLDHGAAPSVKAVTAKEILKAQNSDQWADIQEIMLCPLYFFSPKEWKRVTVLSKTGLELLSSNSNLVKARPDLGEPPSRYSRKQPYFSVV